METIINSLINWGGITALYFWLHKLMSKSFEAEKQAMRAEHEAQMNDLKRQFENDVRRQEMGIKMLINYGQEYYPREIQHEKHFWIQHFNKKNVEKNKTPLGFTKTFQNVPHQDMI